MENPLLKTDWKLLKKQKQTLVKMHFDPKKFNLTKTQEEHIEGLINFLDSIQDFAVENLGQKKGDVFLLHKN